VSRPEGPMLHVNVRLPEDVVEYFRQYTNYTKAMLDVLEQHVREAREQDVEET